MAQHIVLLVVAPPLLLLGAPLAPLLHGLPAGRMRAVVGGLMTATAERADVIFPAASAYEKDGTVTNVTGEVQRLKRALKKMLAEK